MLNLSSDKKDSGYDSNSSKIAIIFMSLQFLGFFYFNGYRVVFPLILEKMKYSELQVVSNWAIIFSVGLFLSSLTRYPMGIVADKLTRKQTITLSSFLISLAIISILFTRNIIVLSLSFALMRTGNHLPPLITRGYVNETDSSRQGKLNAYVSFIANLGGFIGPVLFTFFLEVSIYTLVLFSNLILLILYFFYLTQIPAKKTRNMIPLKTFINDSLHELLHFKKVIILFIILGIVNGIINYLQVPYALYVLDLSGSQTSFLVGVVLLLTTIFILFAGQLTDTLGIQLTIYIGLFIIALGSFIQILDKTNIFFYFISQLLITGGILLGTNSLVTYVTLHSHNVTTASVFGGTSSFYFFGSSLIPIFAQKLYLQDPLLPYWLMIIVSAIIFPLGFILNKKNNIKVSFQKTDPLP